MYVVLTLRPVSSLLLKPSFRSDFDQGSARSPQTPNAGRADARGLDRIGLETALFNKIRPLELSGVVTPVACPSLDKYQRLEPALRARLGPVVFRQKPAAAIEAEILRLRSAYLARRAETRTPAHTS